MRINTNLTAMNTYTQYTKNNNKIASSVEKLSSGYAINSAADNATGLAISEKMRAQIRGLEKASTNSQDAISLVQTAEGSLGESEEILQRMRELAVQSASDTNEDEIDRTALQDEFSQLQSELNDIAGNTTFNKKTLLDGSLSSSTRNLTSTSLRNSGMTIELGNASTGTYNFSVTTKLESAAVEGKTPTSAELVKDGTGNYFESTSTQADGTTAIDSVVLGGNVEKSDLLNGNYTLSATYGDDNCITVTATGDNDQVFSATISAASLAALADSSKNGALAMTFNADAGDAFTVNVNLSDAIASNETNFDTLAENISKMTVSVSGGVTAQEAEYGVYANLTGAESIKLESGMDSVSFDNGVKINFDTLTASAVDTTNTATMDDIDGTAITSATAAWSNLSAADNSAIANGNLKITSTLDSDTATFKAVDGNGKEYTATASAASLVNKTEESATTKTTLTFKDAAGNESFTMDYTTTTSTTDENHLFINDAAGVTAYVTDAGHNYSKTFGDTVADGGFAESESVASSAFNAAVTSAAYSHFTAGSTSNVAAGEMTITTTNSLATDAATGLITFTAKDAAGNTYTAGGALSTTYLSTTANTSIPNQTLTFTDTSDPTNTFTLQLDTESDAAGNFIKDDTTGTTITVEGDLATTTASKFSVEETKNEGLTFQVGANEGDEMTIYIDKMDANYLGVASASVATQTAASSAIDDVDDAINQVSSQRAYLGAIQNRLDHKIANLDTSAENLTSAESQIRDVDMAKEMTNFTNSNILQQAATAMLAQANSLPQNVLSLLG